MTEDFSNNIEYFLIETTVLQKKAPKVHAWIKQHFGEKFKLSKGKNK